WPIPRWGRPMNGRTKRRRSSIAQPNRHALGTMLSCALATSGTAQVHQIAFEWDASQPAQKAAVDTCVASSPNRMIVASNQVLRLMDRSGGEVATINVRVGSGTGTTNPDFIFDHDSVAWRY